jgi:tripartite-type tricarboxylate transporter receptor subunit TctC
VAPASAQTWPSQPITMIVPFSAGGGSDPVARLLAEGLSESLGQPVLVEFRPGGSATVGTSLVAQAKPDGYTILLTPNSPVVNAKYTVPNLPYDVEDLVPITQVTDASVMLVANTGFAPNTFQEVLDYAKANPGKVNLAIQGTGGVSHFAASLIESRLGVEFNKVPYKGAGDMMADMLSGVVNIGFGFPTGFLSGVDAGKLKFVVSLASEQAKSLPNVKTTKQEGFEDIRVSAWLMLFAPKGTPDDVTKKISDATNAFLQQPEVQTKLEQLGYSVTADSTPEKAAALLAHDRKDFQAVIESGAMKLEQ